MLPAPPVVRPLLRQRDPYAYIRTLPTFLFLLMLRVVFADHPPTQQRYVARDQPTCLPKPTTHPAVQRYSSTIHFHDPPPCRGSSHSSPGARLRTPLARRVGHRRPFFLRGPRGLPCAAGLARLRCCTSRTAATTPTGPVYVHTHTTDVPILAHALDCVC